jgi:hypothetical protein
LLASKQTKFIRNQYLYELSQISDSLGAIMRETIARCEVVKKQHSGGWRDLAAGGSA